MSNLKCLNWTGKQVWKSIQYSEIQSKELYGIVMANTEYNHELHE